MSDESAYRSRLTLRWGPSTGPSHPRPGDVTDAEDPRLAALRDAVAAPVVTSMLTAEELEELTVRWGVDGHEGDVWVRVVAVGEVFQDWLTSPVWRRGEAGAQPLDAAECAARLADHLQDWIAESRFGWGQRRISAHVLPAPEPGS